MARRPARAAPSASPSMSMPNPLSLEPAEDATDRRSRTDRAAAVRPAHRASGASSTCSIASASRGLLRAGAGGREPSGIAAGLRSSAATRSACTAISTRSPRSRPTRNSPARSTRRIDVFRKPGRHRSEGISFAGLGDDAAMLAEVKRRGPLRQLADGLRPSLHDRRRHEVPVLWAVDDAVYFNFTGSPADRGPPSATGRQSSRPGSTNGTCSIADGRPDDADGP